MAFHAVGHPSPVNISGINLTFLLPMMPVVELEDAYHDILSGYRLDPPSPGERLKRFAVNDATRNLANLATRQR